MYNIEADRIVEILGINTLDQLKELETLIKDYEAQDKKEFDELKIKIDRENRLHNK